MTFHGFCDKLFMIHRGKNIRSFEKGEVYGKERCFKAVHMALAGLWINVRVGL